jgi:chromosomal replication initiator protein
LELPAQREPTAAWREICTELRRAVGESTYEIWLAPLQPHSWDGHLLVLHAPPDTEAWISKRFAHVLATCARTVAGPDARVVFAGAASTEPTSPRQPGLELENAFNPRYTFDQFIIGEGNRLAHAAALAVAELPGQAYNPLFLYAPPGLGKTHLLHAIGNYVSAFGAGASVRYATVESFTNHFIAALGSRSVERFKQVYRDADVLLIDDVQFLASKAKTEEEFFHTFNALHETGRQLVITCDRLPQHLVSVQERLRERFEAGLVAEITAPDYATRVAILRKRVALDQILLADPAVLDLIADRVPDNVRALEGALIRVVAHHSLARRPLDLELATEVLDAIYPSATTAAPSIEEIQAAVASYYELTVAELTSANRAARLAWPRQLALHLARELTDCSLQAIGHAFGNRNHATVLHACKRVSDRVHTDPSAADELDRLRTRVRERDDTDRPA